MIDSEQNVMSNQILCFLLLKLNRFNPLNLAKFQTKVNRERLFVGLFLRFFSQLIIAKKKKDKKKRYSNHILEV